MCDMSESTVTSKGQVTIPQEIRKALGIRQGSRVTFAAKNGMVQLRVLHRAPETIQSGFGMLGARGKQVPADFDVASLLGPAEGGRRKPARAVAATAKRAGKR